jgi:hypothetical protein
MIVRLSGTIPVQSRACTLARTVSPLIADPIYCGWIVLLGVGDLNWYRFVWYGLPVCGLYPRPICKSIVSCSKNPLI